MNSLPKSSVGSKSKYTLFVSRCGLHRTELETPQLGAAVYVFIAKSDKDFKPFPTNQLKTLRQMRISITHSNEISLKKKLDLIVDGIFGYSLKGNPRGIAAQLIEWANHQSVPSLALDSPSGLDTITGTIFQPASQATATLTLALLKKDFLVSSAKKQIGELYLADISVPLEIYSKPPLELKVSNIFTQNEVIRLW